MREALPLHSATYVNLPISCWLSVADTRLEENGLGTSCAESLR